MSNVLKQLALKMFWSGIPSFREQEQLLGVFALLFYASTKFRRCSHWRLLPSSQQWAQLTSMLSTSIQT